MSSTSHTNSTKAALLLPLGFSGESPGAGQMRCRSSRISKEGMQSMASCICKKSKLILFGSISLIDNMAMFHQSCDDISAIQLMQASVLDWFDYELRQVV